MTGFARVQTETPEFRLSVNIKSVNHRSLDLQVRLPPELEPFEMGVRQAVKKRVARGYIQVNASVTLQAPAQVHIKQEIVEAYLNAYRELAKTHAILAEPDLNVLFRLPGVMAFDEAGEGPPAGLEKALAQTLDRALDELACSREREATGIVEEMLRRSQAIESSRAGIEQLRQGLTPFLMERLTQRLSELLKSAAVDPQRILQEAAFISDRTDISEEVQRLGAHNNQLRALITPSSASAEVGKKLDFLLQEMNREANTILSKTSGIGEAGLAITDLALAARAEIEKIREQAMNLE
jgi:uncharacterized protein (TIGR00255 family)